MTLTRLTGWGRTAPTLAELTHPPDLQALRTMLAQAGHRGLIVRGLGRSYGDPAQNAGGQVLDLTAWNAVLELDQSLPAVRVQAGTSLDQLLRYLLGFGLWLPVIPGTRQVTVGGAIAADVHGKNHHLDGSFGSHVISLDLLLPSGDVVTLTPRGDDADLFWATVGGMGLTGVVLEATIELTRVETSYFVVDTERISDVVTLMDTIAGGDQDYPYSVAWFDTSTGGRRLGRSVLTRGRSARLEDLDPAQRAHALTFAAHQRGHVRLTPPISLVNRFSARAFNSFWYAKASQRRSSEVQNITQFFHPLDVVGDWNRLYGRRGFCQYQFVVPHSAQSAFTDAVQHLADSAQISSLNVLKQFGDANRSPMSFPIPGWTLAVDLPLSAGLQQLLSRLDTLVADAGGRVYLAKDSRTSATMIRRMYPRLDEFQSIRDRVDPHRVLQSDLSRRLDL